MYHQIENNRELTVAQKERKERRIQKMKDTKKRIRSTPGTLQQAEKNAYDLQLQQMDSYYRLKVDRANRLKQLRKEKDRQIEAGEKVTVDLMEVGHIPTKPDFTWTGGMPRTYPIRHAIPKHKVNDKVIPKYFATPCDFCHTVFYTTHTDVQKEKNILNDLKSTKRDIEKNGDMTLKEKEKRLMNLNEEEKLRKRVILGNKRNIHGHPNFLVCRYCYNWSISGKNRKYAGILDGTIERPPLDSGKSFSSSWSNNYKRPVKNKNKKDPATMVENVGAVVGTAVETVKDDLKAAVAVAQSGVSGLMQGVTDAFSSLTGTEQPNKKK